MSKIQPIILAGGSGTRLWPLSRQNFPKQFSKIIGTNSLFQETLLRFKSSKKLSFENPVIITGEDFRFIVKEQLEEMLIEPKSIIIEPSGKNTGPALLAATLSQQKENNSHFIMSPSDHYIADTNQFHSDIKLGLNDSENGNFVIFGVKPSRIETGYGYLKIEKTDTINDKIVNVIKFIEKPSFKKAKEYFSTNVYLWNSGIILFNSKTLINAYKNYDPLDLKKIIHSVNNGYTDLNFFRLNELNWKKCKSISIDYAILEKTKNLKAIKVTSSWDDLGNWDSIWQISKKNNKGVFNTKNVTSIDSNNSLIMGLDEKQHIISIGIENLNVVATNDAILISSKNKSEELKRIIEKLRSKNLSQAKQHTKDFRPWGWFDSIFKQENYQIKMLCVKPGQSLSLQKHKYRSEHWVVVKGEAKVTIANKIKKIKVGESVYIPLKVKHRLENEHDKIDLMIVEVQTGSYLGEDDIIRYEDNYSRQTF